MLFIILSYSLYKQVIKQPDLPERWSQIKAGWENVLFWITFLLMFLNWGIESIKWKLLIFPLQKISFFTSFKAVLSGCSITMLTPNRVGEYGGRVMYIDEGNRIEAVSLTILGSVSQLSITIIMGVLGIIYIDSHPDISFKFKEIFNVSSQLMLIIGIVCAIFLLLFLFTAGLFIKWFSHFKFGQKIVKHIHCIDQVSRKHLLIILLLSFLRYMIFILQYVLLLRVMQVNIDLNLSVWLISVFYFFMAIVPTVGFTELPVRATVSVLILGLFSSNIIGIHAASFLIWCINLVVPAIIGSLFILGIKIIKTR